jgi:SpoVK/Ycf46/Vps4 family AAA+-type ATPase
MSSIYEKQFRVKISSGLPIIQIISYEWKRIHGLCVKTAYHYNRALFKWNNIEGIIKWDHLDRKFIPEEQARKTPSEALEWYFQQHENELIFLMEDLHRYFDGNQSNEVIGYLRAICQHESTQKTLIISQPIPHIPTELEKEIYVLEIPLPDQSIIQTMLEGVIQDYNLSLEQAPLTERNEIIAATLGLTSSEADFLYREIAEEHNKITLEEISEIIARKEQIIKKSGILEYFHPTETMDGVGGMENLKQWLSERRRGFEPEAEAFGLKPPKGVLLLGIPGCGKSLIGKAMAAAWKLPLLKFDIGKVYAGFVGESERNIRKALDIADAVSPCILWVDEIEKGLSGVSSSDQSDGGTTARVFGTLLTWMQEKTKPVFIVATANSVESLPPELLRKGRFDEIFFVDLPSKEIRRDIWNIHLSKRLNERYVQSNFDLESIVSSSIGFSGSEIEEAVNSALYKAYYNQTEVTTDEILESINEIYPLSRVMGETINKLREWARVRTRLANITEGEALESSDKEPRLKNEYKNPFI